MLESETGPDDLDFNSSGNEALSIAESNPLETFEQSDKRSSEIDLSSPPSYPSYWGDGCWGVPNVENNLL